MEGILNLPPYSQAYLTLILDVPSPFAAYQYSYRTADQHSAESQKLQSWLAVFKSLMWFSQIKALPACAGIFAGRVE